MTFRSPTEMANSWQNGLHWMQPIHKTATPLLTAAGYWGDLSMAAGTPKYNAYVGNQYEFTPMVGNSNFGINTGGGSNNRYISRLMMGGSGVASTAFPANIIIADYAGFYPLVDMDSTDQQDMDNTAAVPRYTSGLRLMCVCTTPQTAPSPIQCTVTYLNQVGATSQVSFFVQAANVGQINCFHNNTAGVVSASPLVPLAPGDYCVTRLVSVTNQNSAGGFCAFALVKTLCGLHIPDIITPVEIDLLMHRSPVPEVQPGSYLNIIYQPVTGGTVSGIVRGQIDFIRRT